MLTLNINCEVMPDRVVTFKLPETVRPGRHELVVVLEEDELAQVKTDSNAQTLMQFAGSVMAFKQIDGVEYQREVRTQKRRERLIMISRRTGSESMRVNAEFDVIEGKS